MEYVGSFLFFGFFGWIFENAFSGKYMCNPLVEHIFPYICIIPILILYAIGGVLVMWAYKNIPDLWTRVVFYFIAFNLLELIGGVVGKYFICPYINTCKEKTMMWDYSSSSYDLWGYIDIKHALIWPILGLGAELLVSKIY